MRQLPQNKIMVAPKALQAKTDDAFHAVLRQMSGELKLSHFSVFPAKAELKSENSLQDRNGFETKIIENQPSFHNRNRKILFQ